MTDLAQSGDAVAVARNYYNSDDAEHFYSQVWGGEDIHIGIYQRADEPIADASRRAVERMADKIPTWSAGTRLVDLGSGYCGGARYLAKRFGVQVAAINLSEVENERARMLNQAAGVADLIKVHTGSFESLPFAEGTFDVAWSQDAILHSENRSQVLAEALRVLASGGMFIFTDPMQADDCPAAVLTPILERIHLSSLGSPGFYRSTAEKLGFEVVGFENLTPQLVMHYTRVLQQTDVQTPALRKSVSERYITQMKKGLKHWIDGGRAGHLCWGIFALRKP